ncbi:MAG: CoA-binding protein, partial [Candidatus Binatia bacterium]
MNETALRTGIVPLIQPRAIALVGCSPEEERIAGLPLRLLLQNGYPGKIFPITPKYEEIRGLR